MLWSETNKKSYFLPHPFIIEQLWSFVNKFSITSTFSNIALLLHKLNLINTFSIQTLATCLAFLINSCFHFVNGYHESLYRKSSVINLIYPEQEIFPLNTWMDGHVFMHLFVCLSRWKSNLWAGVSDEKCISLMKILFRAQRWPQIKKGIKSNLRIQF
jgi:hypothetical protein